MENVILPSRTLQFADDTVIIMDVQPRDLSIVQSVLKNFAQILGLHINDNKSANLPLGGIWALCQLVIHHACLAEQCRWAFLRLSYCYNCRFLAAHCVMEEEMNVCLAALRLGGGDTHQEEKEGE